MSEKRVTDVFPRGTVSNNEENAAKLIFLLQPDGTFRAYTLQVGWDPNGDEHVVAVEADGTQRHQVLLWDYTGAAQIRAAGEATTGELRVVPLGEDEGANLDRFRTDPNRIPWVRIYGEPYYYGSIQVPAAEADLWDPAVADTIHLAVEFNVVNDDPGALGVTGLYVGREINSAGGLARPYYWLFNETVPYPGETGWCGPFIMHGDDAVRGYRAAAAQCSITFRAHRVDTGA